MKTTQDLEANHVGANHETILEMARRHVREGEERIARQEGVLAKLDRDNHPQAAVLGRAVLETMRLSLNLSKQHLRALEEKSKS